MPGIIWVGQRSIFQSQIVFDKRFFPDVPRLSNLHLNVCKIQNRYITETRKERNGREN